MNKKVISLIIAMVMSLSFIGCGDKKQDNGKQENNTSGTIQKEEAKTDSSDTSDNKDTENKETSEKDDANKEDGDSTVTSNDETSSNSNSSNTSSNTGNTSSSEPKNQLKKFRIYSFSIEDYSLKYKEKEIEVSDSTNYAELFEKEFETALDANTPPLLKPAVKINKVYFNKNKVLTIDFASNFNEAMGLGSGPEAATLEAIVNTLGYAFNVKEVIITLDGKPYSSGHIVKDPGETFKVKIQ